MHRTFVIFNDYRRKKQWSYREFSDKIGLPYSIVYKTLKGITTPHDYNRECFEKYYRENTQDILQTLIGQTDAKNTTAVL